MHKVLVVTMRLWIVLLLAFKEEKLVCARALAVLE
jgi:hypothetical protein